MLDEVVGPSELGSQAAEFAAACATPDRRAHSESKLRLRRPTLRRLRAAIEADRAEMAAAAVPT